MALFIDQKYVSYLAPSLEGFTKLSPTLWNFRCPICLDSKTNKNKKRGYLYTVSQSVMYQCHNCGISLPLGKFIEHVNPVLAADYRRENFIESGQNTKKFTKKETPEFGKPDMSRLSSKPEPRLLDSLMDRLDSLPDDNEAVQYCLSRGIPRDQFHKMYYLPHICDIVQLSEKYRDRVTGKEPRLVLPFFNTSGKLTGVTCRAMRGENLRYVAIKIAEDESMIFGIEDIDKWLPIYVTEGPIDSLFIPNAIAVGGSAMGKLSSLQLPKDKMVIVFDNQPRETQICKLIAKAIKNGYNVVIWDSNIQEKDVNEMQQAGVDYMNQLKTRVFSGLRAELEFNKWKKC